MTDQIPMFKQHDHDGAVSYDICRTHHGDNPESVAANPSDSAKARDKATILAWFVAHGPATCEAAELALGMRHQTCSARVSELRSTGALVKCGKGTTSSGRAAALLAVKGDDHEPQP